MYSIKSLIKKLLNLHTGSVEQEKFVSKVKNALAKGEFEAYYQPQYNYDTKEMSGAEALMRWNCPQNGLVAPGQFIPGLEKCGLIYEVDKFIWRRVCSDIKDLQAKGLKVPHISVNISGVDIYRQDFESYLLSIVEEFGLSPKQLHLEITETVYVKDLKYMVGVVQSLQQKGFVVEMDDFGSGYSSLKNLKNVPFDVIKLDMDFVQESETNEKAKNILGSVIDMLKKIKVPMIVEGVECETQAEILNRQGCSYMQGYYFGKPVKKSEFEELLKNI